MRQAQHCSLKPLSGTPTARPLAHFSRDLFFIHGRVYLATPSAQKGGGGRPKTQDAAQLHAEREPLLRRQNHTGPLSPGTDPLAVKSIEIGDVERIEDTLNVSRRRPTVPRQASR